LYQDLVPRDDPLWQLYLAVRNFTTPTGNELAEAFLSLPSRYTAPYPSRPSSEAARNQPMSIFFYISGRLDCKKPVKKTDVPLTF
jgi:hypothetical protein